MWFGWLSINEIRVLEIFIFNFDKVCRKSKFIGKIFKFLTKKLVW